MIGRPMARLVLYSSLTSPDWRLGNAGDRRSQQTAFVIHERLGVKSPVAVLARLEAQHGMTLCGPSKNNENDIHEDDTDDGSGSGTIQRGLAG